MTKKFGDLKFRNFQTIDSNLNSFFKSMKIESDILLMNFLPKKLGFDYIIETLPNIKSAKRQLFE